MKINTIIIEDEIMARKAITNFCNRIPEINLIGTFEEPSKVLAKLPTLDIDLILLDIEMPNMTGLEFLEKLPYHPDIIFTTSNPKYAYYAYEHQVIDFLKKPISFPRFQQGIQKIINNQRQVKPRDGNDIQQFFIKDGTRLIRIDYDAVLYLENAGDYVKIVTAEKTFVFYSTLKDLEKKLPESTFLRVHRSFIINLNKIKDIEDSTLVINKKVIPISRSKRPILMDKIHLI